MMQQHSPNNFNAKDPENALSQQDKAFERICITLEENGARDPQKLTEYSFYSRLNYLEEKFSKEKPNNEFIAE